eukprot:6433050-Lingulodinium_polyedra.AAC.1
MTKSPRWSRSCRLFAGLCQWKWCRRLLLWGRRRATVRWSELLKRSRATAALCGMLWRPEWEARFQRTAP